MRMIGMPKNFIGARPGRVYSWGGSASIQTASGTVVTFPQSAERAFSGLSIYGHSTQDGTPSPDNPVPIVSAGDSGEINVAVSGKNLIPFPYLSPLGGAGTVYEVDGVTYTVQADGGIKCVGTPTSIFGPTLCKIRFSEESLNANNSESATNGKVTLSGGPLYFDSNNNATFIYWDNQIDTPVDMTIYPQVEYGTVATAYEPYKTPQTLTFSTPDGLPGIPVTSGGNYTDESGQQWICDEIDFQRGKYVQRVGKVELDGTEAFELVQGIESGQPFFILRNSINSGQSTLNGYSNYFPIVSITIRGKEQGIGGWGTDLYLRWTELFSAVEDLKSFLSEKYTSGNPVRVSYILATPIETDLPAEEIASYKALHTYSPTTTVSNDAEAWMKVGYKE